MLGPDAPETRGRTRVVRPIVTSVFVAAHARSYSFDFVVPLYGGELAHELAAVWPRVCLLQNAGTTRQRYLALKTLLAGAAAIALDYPKGTVAEFVSCLQSRPIQRVPAALLRAAAEGVATKVRDMGDFSLTSTKEKRYRSAIVTNLNGILRRLADLDLIPPIPKLRGAGREGAFEAKRLTLGELTPAGAAAAPCSSPSLDDHAEAVLSLCEKRLNGLRACLVREFSAEWDAFVQGQAWLKDEHLPCTAEVDKATAGLWRFSRGEKLRSATAERLRERLNISPDQFLPVAVRWLHDMHGGVVLATRAPIRTLTLMALAGGIDAVVRRLEANRIATNAAFGILLCDSGMNVAPASAIPAEPYISDAKRGVRRIATIASHKMRAEGKLVHAALVDDGEADLPIRDPYHDLSCLTVIERYREMVAPLRMRAVRQGSASAGLLFLHSKGTSANGGPISSDMQSFAGEHWPAFLARHCDDPIIGGLPITRSMIRKTVLLLRAGRSSFSTAPAQALAEHRQAGTTATYLDAAFMGRQLDEQIRTFMDLFEAALVTGISGAATLTQTTQDELERRLAIALECGLDFACVREAFPPARRTSLDPSCTPLEPCDQCPVRRFVPNEGNFLTLYLAHQALLNAERELPSMNPARWALFWMPWRAVTEAYVRKIRGSHYAVQFNQVVTAAERRLAAGQLCLPIVR